MQINSASTTTYTRDDAPSPQRPADVTQEADAPSSVKSLAYGALGLERPEMQATDTNGFYTAGKWMAAAVTIGGIVSLFVRWSRARELIAGNNLHDWRFAPHIESRCIAGRSRCVMSALDMTPSFLRHYARSCKLNLQSASAFSPCAARSLP